MNVDMRAVVPVAQMAGDDSEDTELLRAALSEAFQYIGGFPWCVGIQEAFFGMGCGGVVAVFLFRLARPSDSDEWLWVITGDLPPAYLVTDEARTPAAALGVYCGLMEDWIAAVKAGASLDDVFPVDVAPTNQNAESLATRIDFLRKEILPTF